MSPLLPSSSYFISRVPIAQSLEVHSNTLQSSQEDKNVREDAYPLTPPLLTLPSLDSRPMQRRLSGRGNFAELNRNLPGYAARGLELSGISFTS